MDTYIKFRLDRIEQMARQILRDIEGIYGYCAGIEIVANDYTNEILKPQLNQGNRVNKTISDTTTTQPDKKSVKQIIKEVQEMLIELKIKGSIREHRNGLLKFTSTVFGVIYGRSKEEIENKLKNKIKQLKNNPQKDKKEKNTPLLSVFYRTEYLPYKQRQGRAKSTLNAYDYAINFIIKMNFDKPLNQYKAKEIEDFIYSFPETRKRQTLQGLLNNIFNRAITLGIIKNNPCTTIEKAVHIKEQGTAFSFDDQLEFFQTIYNFNDLPYADKCYFVFVYLVGARRNEALAVTAEDVDFANKVLHIRGTKTDGSDRYIPLTPLVEKLLRSLKVKKGKYFKISEAKTDIYFRKVWDKKKGHKLHDLRHTYGTIQICVNKVDIKTVSLWLGHSTIDTTLRIYTHPEQLDNGTFLNGSLSETEKTMIYAEKYAKILKSINNFIQIV